MVLYPRKIFLCSEKKAGKTIGLGVNAAYVIITLLFASQTGQIPIIMHCKIRGREKGRGEWGIIKCFKLGIDGFYVYLCKDLKFLRRGIGKYMYK